MFRDLATLGIILFGGWLVLGTVLGLLDVAAEPFRRFKITRR